MDIFLLISVDNAGYVNDAEIEKQQEAQMQMSNDDDYEPPPLYQDVDTDYEDFTAF